MFVTTLTSAKQKEDNISRGKPHSHTQRTTTPNLSIQTKTQLHRSGITFYKNQHTALFLDCAVRITQGCFFSLLYGHHKDHCDVIRTYQGESEEAALLKPAAASPSSPETSGELPEPQRDPGSPQTPQGAHR